MKGVIPGGSLNRLRGHIDRYEDSLPLQPFGSQAVFMIGPFALGDNTPGSWPEDHGAEAEFIEGKHAAPFGRMPKGGDGVSQYWQDAAFCAV